MTAAAAPLAGLRVIELSHTIMGPCAGLLLADLGADVIKIEPIDGDRTRRLPGFGIGFFAAFNRNKRSIAVDLKKPEGQAVVHRLAAKADILLENFGPGTIERLGCGWDALEKINPRLVYLALKGFLAGPYEERGALDEVVQMQTGLAYMTGLPERPLRVGASVIDILGAVFGVAGVLAALRERDRTGRGQRVGSALFESSAFLMGSHILAGVMLGEPLPPLSVRKSPWGVYDVFETADGARVFVGVISETQVTHLCAAFDLQDLASNPDLDGNSARVAARPWLIPKLAEVFKARACADILSRCEAASLPHARVAHPDDLTHDPHMIESGGLIATALSAYDRAQTADIPGPPLEFGPERARLSLRLQPPTISEHAAAILEEAGFDAEAAADLFARGCVRNPKEQAAP